MEKKIEERPKRTSSTMVPYGGHHLGGGDSDICFAFILIIAVAIIAFVFGIAFTMDYFAVFVSQCGG